MLKKLAIFFKCLFLSFFIPLFATQENVTNKKLLNEHSMNQSNILSIEMLFDAQTEIFNLLKDHSSKLIEIQNTELSILEKWQQFLRVILPLQIQVIKTYGFSDDQLGLSSFNEQYMKQAITHPYLSELNQQKWLFLFETTFGVTEFKEISLLEAQSLIADITSEMTSDSFLNQIDSAMNILDQDSTLIQKRTALLNILFPLHMSVMAKHGFKGDRGYIQAQRAIMDYYYDPQIAQDAAHAQSVVFKRAKLI